MLDLTRDIELTRLAIVLGVIVGTLIYQRTGLTLGGVIIPGFFALSFPHPLHLVSTLLISVLTYLLIHKVLLQRKIFYGRQLMEIEVLVGLCLQIIWTLIMTALGQYSDTFALFIGVGMVLPGIIAHDMARQGVWRTLGSSLLGAAVVYMLVNLIGSLMEILPRLDLIPTPFFRSQPDPFAFPIAYIPFAIIVSVLLGIFVLKRFELHTVGFAATAYYALLFLRPLDLLLLLACALLTYFLVVFGVQRVALVFGRAKLATMILMGVVIAWSAELLVVYLSRGLYNPWVGIKAMVPLLVALLANEIERQGFKKATLATAISTVVIVGVMQAGQWLLHWIAPV